MHSTLFHPSARSGSLVTSLLATLLLLFLPVAAVPVQAGPDDTPEAAGAVEHVIHISVDGLRADAVARSGEALPNFYRLRSEGTYTFNARTDFDYTNTLPNHMSQLTGRRVTGDQGHNWTKNSDPDESETLHSNKGDYVASVFDVVHNNGYSTAAYVSKSKFVLLDQSYGPETGAPDLIGEDNGRDKIDTFVYESDTDALVDRFLEDMKTEPYGYSFVHLCDPDSEGHWNTWSVHSHSEYMEGVVHADELLGKIMDAVESDPNLAENTVILVTADHGGDSYGHGNAEWTANYTIPFFVWGSGVKQGESYTLNPHTRQHPGISRPDYKGIQPIRNGDAANLATSLLGAGTIPGSTINAQANFAVLEQPIERDIQVASNEVAPSDGARGGAEDAARGGAEDASDAAPGSAAR